MVLCSNDCSICLLVNDGTSRPTFCLPPPPNINSSPQGALGAYTVTLPATSTKLSTSSIACPLHYTTIHR